jgi:hypothetical protein
MLSAEGASGAAVGTGPAGSAAGGCGGEVGLALNSWVVAAGAAGSFAPQPEIALISATDRHALM